jgi:predicted transcriptional regulator
MRLLEGRRVHHKEVHEMKQLSEETQRKIVEFFMKTSVPRILASLEKEENLAKENEKEAS